MLLEPMAAFGSTPHAGADDTIAVWAAPGDHTTSQETRLISGFGAMSALQRAICVASPVATSTTVVVCSISIPDHVVAGKPQATANKATIQNLGDGYDSRAITALFVIGQSAIVACQEVLSC